LIAEDLFGAWKNIFILIKQRVEFILFYITILLYKRRGRKHIFLREGEK
jgi:hypothetical protein